MSFFKTLFSRFFSNGKELVYTAFSNEEYFKAIAKLKDNGIKYTIKRKQRNSDQPSPILMLDHHPDTTHYEIYVSEDDLHKASQVVSQK